MEESEIIALSEWLALARREFSAYQMAYRAKLYNISINEIKQKIKSGRRQKKARPM
ncbi:hypothetical protein [Anabaena sp. UHCC 0451]|uniref:hypothetical protein n=1 Tax=Anabaena sp. UHCC 0451 TaxID=2055235 RepID=UPI002B219853|nr:hypothetical protein [Anabaena sp. UHCC 0451]MEA5578490.1 hypothetical protein [Anabaena sp. UHCC 0451]